MLSAIPMWARAIKLAEGDCVCCLQTKISPRRRRGGFIVKVRHQTFAVSINLHIVPEPGAEAEIKKLNAASLYRVLRWDARTRSSLNFVRSNLFSVLVLLPTSLADDAFCQDTNSKNFSLASPSPLLYNLMSCKSRRREKSGVVCDLVLLSFTQQLFFFLPFVAPLSVQSLRLFFLSVRLRKGKRHISRKELKRKVCVFNGSEMERNEPIRQGKYGRSEILPLRKCAHAKANNRKFPHLVKINHFVVVINANIWFMRFLPFLLPSGPSTSTNNNYQSASQLGNNQDSQQQQQQSQTQHLMHQQSANISSSNNNLISNNNYGNYGNTTTTTISSAAAPTSTNHYGTSTNSQSISRPMQKVSGKEKKTKIIEINFVEEKGQPWPEIRIIIIPYNLL